MLEHVVITFADSIAWALKWALVIWAIGRMAGKAIDYWLADQTAVKTKMKEAKENPIE